MLPRDPLKGALMNNYSDTVVASTIDSIYASTIHIINGICASTVLDQPVVLLQHQRPAGIKFVA